MNADKLKKILADHKLWVERVVASEKRSDLNGANLRGADLNDANLSGADLRYANLQRADLRNADLSRAVLSRSDLHGADLRGADLRGAHLNGANLSYADLRGAHFELEFKSVRYFRNTIFSWKDLPWVILNPQWSELADSVKFV